MAKLSAAQKLAIGYYRTKLNIINSISTRWAANMALDVFTKPYPVKKKQDPAIWHEAEKLFLDTDYGRLAGYKWQPKKPNGKKLLIVHGFAGNSRSFDRYIKPSLAMGYEVYAYDAPAHGSSPGKRLNVDMYMQVIEQIIGIHGEFDAYMAHSLGGLSLMLSLHHLTYNNKPRIILIAPATETTTAADNFFGFLQLPKKLRAPFEQKIAETGRAPLQWYSVSRVLHEVNGEILWLHDEDDKITPIKDVYPLMDPHPTHVHFYFTKNLGHSRIYYDSKVRKKILEFLG
jgi:pimeloyl-ACP methyl ester carboxylesterase